MQTQITGFNSQQEKLFLIIVNNTMQASHKMAVLVSSWEKTARTNIVTHTSIHIIISILTTYVHQIRI